MIDPSAAAVFLVFAFAGFIKGVLGFGLPTVSVALLTTIISPAHAVALVVVPSLVTNIWQAISGPDLWSLVKRLSPMLTAACIGIWLGGGWLSGSYARYSVVAIGILLIAYAALSLAAFSVNIPKEREIWLGPIVGVFAGLTMAGTGVFVPAIIYLQAVGFEKDRLVQALGLSFTISTIALAINLIGAGLLSISLATGAMLALAAALFGMATGQATRRFIDQITFRRWFFVALLLLGVYLSAAPILRG